MNYIDPEEDLVFFNKEGGIYSGGFRVSTLAAKKGFSPIITLNNSDNKNGGGGSVGENVSDLFTNLVVPNWALSYNLTGGSFKDEEETTYESDDEDNIIPNDLHDELLKLVTVNAKVNKRKSRKASNIDKNNKNNKNNKNKKTKKTRN
jgi:predicted membrane GTPase involved in stress response